MCTAIHPEDAWECQSCRDAHQKWSGRPSCGLLGFAVVHKLSVSGVYFSWVELAKIVNYQSRGLHLPCPHWVKMLKRQRDLKQSPCLTR